MHDTNTPESLLQRAGQIPSARDWEIYRNVKVQEWSTRITADEFRISQTRVCQIVERVAEYVAATAPVLNEADEARQMFAAKQLAAERLGFLYGEAVRCFHRSVGKVQTVREPHGAGQSGCTTWRYSHGDSRYLQAAARLAVLGSQLPNSRMPTAACEENPANEDYSAGAAEQPEKAPAKAEKSPATAAAMVSCVEQSRGNSAAKVAAARPVQAAGRKPANSRQASQREAFFQTG